MNDDREYPETRPEAERKPETPKPRMHGSMHDNVPVWSDPCCSCEPEPYWTEVAEDLGIDFGEQKDAGKTLGQPE